MIEHVKASQVKTQTMFAELYKRVARLARDPIANLFAELEQFISGDDQAGEVDVTAAVNRFFDDLFPRLYGQTTRGVQGPAVSRATVRDLSREYVECLRGAQTELRPFGEIPRRLASSLSRSLDASRSLLQSIKLGLDVLNATDHTELNEDCSAALLRSTHCAQCRGYAAARPCRGLCSNVARGCLAGVADVDQPWNEWIDAMERLTGALVNGDLGTHDILSSIDSRLSEAVLYALENGPILEKKVSSRHVPNTVGHGPML
jgi:Glypican